MSAYRYRAYGLEIQADRFLPGLMHSGRGVPDIVVRRGRIDVPAEEGGQNRGREVWVQGDDVIVRWEQFGSVLVRGGREVIVDPRSGVDERIPGLMVVGAAMGILLHQRGSFTLHASAAAVDGQAVLFLGGKGSGKSTTAFAFCRHGYRFVTDDIAALHVDDAGDVVIAPGAPSTKLTDRAASVFQVDESELSIVRTGLPKRYRSLRRQFETRPLPVRHIYVLDSLEEGSALPTVESMNLRQAVMQLVSHSFALRFVGEDGNESRNLDQAARVARRTSVCRLRRSKDLSMLPAIVECVEEDILSHNRAVI